MIAEGNVKLRHLQHRPACSLVVFETVPAFRGMEVQGEPDLLRADVAQARAAIAGRYLGVQAGLEFARQRNKPGVRVRLDASAPRVWDLTAILPRSP